MAVHPWEFVTVGNFSCLSDFTWHWMLP